MLNPRIQEAKKLVLLLNEHLTPSTKAFNASKFLQQQPQMKLTTSANLSTINNPKSARLVDMLTEHVSLIGKRKEIVNYNEKKFYDPPYINKESPFPNYELLNINVKGYDYTVLDRFYKYIERLCSSFEVSVVEAYAMPCRSFKIKTYQPFSSNLDKEFKLNNYHRIVRIQNLKSTIAPFLFETIQLNLPEGVQLSVTIPTTEDDEFRYVPDIELDELKQKLEEATRKPKDNAKR